MNRAFVMKPPAPPWGDYGRILIHSICSNLRGESAPTLERVGNLVPPCTFPTVVDVVVTESAKTADFAAGMGPRRALFEEVDVGPSPDERR